MEWPFTCSEENNLPSHWYAIFCKVSFATKMIKKPLFCLSSAIFCLYFTFLWGTRQTSPVFNDLFKLQKKAIRIITNRTSKIEGKFQNTKPLFKKSNILTVQNLYFYLTTTESSKILNTWSKPEQISDIFIKSGRSNRLLLPKFKNERYKSNSFIFNASKILNHILSDGLDIYAMSQTTLKMNLKRYLMAKQSATIPFVVTLTGTHVIYQFSLILIFDLNH